MSGRSGVVYYPDGADPIDVPSDLSAVQVRAWIAAADGSLVARDGIGRADGTFTIDLVPEEPTLIQVGTLYVVTAARDLDLRFERPGRPDVERGTIDRTVALTLDGASPWGTQDLLELLVPNQWTTRWAIAWTDELDVGATELAFTATPVSIVDDAKGDRGTVVRLASRTTGPAEALIAIERASLPPFSTVDGAAAAAATFDPIDRNRSLSLAWNARAYSGLWREVHLEAFPLFPSWGIYAAVPGGDLDAPWLSSPAAVDAQYWPDAPTELTVAFGDPLPGELPLYLYVEVPFAVELDIGVEDPPLEFTEITRALAVGDYDGEPLLVSVGPVGDQWINGLSARVDHDGVGVTPLLSWRRPGIGVADGYRITLSQVAANLPYPEPLVVFYTQQTELRIPPGLMRDGQRYIFEILAIRAPNTDFAAAPFVHRLPRATAGVITGMFRP